MSTNSSPIPIDGLAYFFQCCVKKGISSIVSESLVNSVGKETLAKYSRLWKYFAEWVNRKKLETDFSVNLICEFLLFKFNNGSSTSYVNSMRSAIGFFSLNCFDLENDIFMKRLFKYFYLKRPIKPKYNTFWPVSQLLNFLRKWHPIESLTMKQLTLKTVALLALTSSDRGQTIHLTKINNMTWDGGELKIVIKDRLKTTRRVLKPKIINVVTSELEEFNVLNYVKSYIERTKEYRQCDQLFISWKSWKPVSKPTLARWLKMALKLSGIDTSKYSAHSFRGASLSSAFFKGVPIDKIVSAGNWKNVSTFKNHYCAPPYDTPIGEIILNS